MSARGLGLKMLIISARPPLNLTDIRLICSRERRNARSAALLRGPSRRLRQVQKALPTRCTQDECAPPFWQIFPGIVYWQIFAWEVFFFNTKDVKISNKETREEILQFNKQTKHENLCYFMVGLLCDVIQTPAYVLEYILFSRNSPRAC